MRIALIVAVLAVLLSGCTWLKERWPWREKEVPVTTPTESALPGEEPPAAPAPPTAPAEPEAAADVPVEDQMMLEDLASPAPPKTAPVETPPVEVIRPEGGSAADSSAEREPEKVVVSTASQQPVAASNAAREPEPKSVPVGKAERLSASVIQINDRFVTVNELLRGAAPEILALPPHLTEDTFRQRVQRILTERVGAHVHEVLVLAEARKNAVAEQDRFIEAEVRKYEQEMIAEAGGSRTKLQQQLAADGRTLKDELEGYGNTVRVRMFLQARFQPAITINRRMLLNYYRQHPEEFSSEKKVLMQILAAPTDLFLPADVARPSAAEKEAARAEAKETVEAASKRLADGADFDKVAKDTAEAIQALHGEKWKDVKSGFGKVCVQKMAADGGRWSMMRAGGFVEPKVQNAAFALAEGGVSGVIEGEQGYYIVKARQVEPGKQVSFEEAQEQIEEKLRERQFEALRKDYFERLLQGATIVQNMEVMQLAVDLAVERWHGREARSE